MKVRKCENCEFYQRKIWTTRYKPANYHTVGVNHAYGFCEKYNKRCLDVKNCSMADMRGEENA